MGAVYDSYHPRKPFNLLKSVHNPVPLSNSLRHHNLTRGHAVQRLRDSAEDSAGGGLRNATLLANCVLERATREEADSGEYLEEKTREEADGGEYLEVKTKYHLCKVASHFHADKEYLKYLALKSTKKKTNLE